MTYSEEVLVAIVQLARTNDTGIFEAASDYCEQHDIDPEEFVATLDPFVIQRLKEDATRERKIRRCVQKPVRTLF